jgi:hypothetical protein
MMKLRSLPSARRMARAPEVTSAPALAPAIPAAAPADVRGLIDNATSDRLYGWAWDAASPGSRLKVELRLAGEVVANTVADFVRPDLAKNGVGDGCHAFEFPLLPDWVERRAELAVIAFGADGSEFPIAVRIRRPDDTQVGTQIQRALEGLIAEQQQIREEFAGLRARAAQLPEAAAVDAIAQAGQALQQRLDSLELWMTRLDGRLGEVAAPAGAAQGGTRGGNGGGRLDPWQAVLIAALASAASVALALAAARTLV